MVRSLLQPSGERNQRDPHCPADFFKVEHIQSPLPRWRAGVVSKRPESSIGRSTRTAKCCGAGGREIITPFQLPRGVNFTAMYLRGGCECPVRKQKSLTVVFPIWFCSLLVFGSLAPLGAQENQPTNVSFEEASGSPFGVFDASRAMVTSDFNVDGNPDH